MQIQPRKCVLDQAEYMAPNRQHELDPTDQEYICPEWSRSSNRDRCSVRGVQVSPQYLFLLNVSTLYGVIMPHKTRTHEHIIAGFSPFEEAISPL